MPITDIVRIHKVNHGSLAMTVPKQVAKELNLKKGSRVRVRSNTKGEMIVKRYD